MNKQESLRDRAVTRRALGFYLALIGLGLLLTWRRTRVRRASGDGRDGKRVGGHANAHIPLD